MRKQGYFLVLSKVLKRRKLLRKVVSAAHGRPILANDLSRSFLGEINSPFV